MAVISTVSSLEIRLPLPQVVVPVPCLIPCQHCCSCKSGCHHCSASVFIVVIAHLIQVYRPEPVAVSFIRSVARIKIETGSAARRAARNWVALASYPARWMSRAIVRQQLNFLVSRRLVCMAV